MISTKINKMHKYFWDSWRAFEKRGEFVNTKQKTKKKKKKKYIYIYIYIYMLYNANFKCQTVPILSIVLVTFVLNADLNYA